MSSIDPPLAVVPPAERLSLVPMFAHAHPLVQVALAILVLAIFASLALWIGQLTPRARRPASALAALTAIAASAPLLGFAAGAYGVMDMFIGIANVRPVPSLSILAPGFAEAMLCVTLGLLAATLATGGRHHLKARLQAVLAEGSPAPAAKPAGLARTALPA
ncbi:MAG: MotA/TolQ/ExbB proton channel family protein [Phenylobacterium sp.]